MPKRWGQGYYELKQLMRRQGLSTICEEARCPNIGECWNERTATFLILGNRCTRRCTFCDVDYAWTGEVDTEEQTIKGDPDQVADRVLLIEGTEPTALADLVYDRLSSDQLMTAGAASMSEPWLYRLEQVVQAADLSR